MRWHHFQTTLGRSSELLVVVAWEGAIFDGWVCTWGSRNARWTLWARQPYWLIDGDHTLHIRAVAKGGGHGFTWDGPNPVLTGDLQFEGLVSAGQSIDAIEVRENATISAEFSGETYLSAPFAIRGDRSASCAPIINDAHFTHLMAQ